MENWKPKKHTLEEEEERRALQKKANSGGVVSVAGTSEDIPKEKFDKPGMSEAVPDGEGYVVVIVDPVDLVRNKKRDKKEENHDFGFNGEVPRLEIQDESVQTRRDQEKAGIREEEMNSIGKDKKEMALSTSKGYGCSSKNKRDIRRREPETSSISATQHTTGSSVRVDMVEDLPHTQSWDCLFNWDDFGYSLIFGFAPTAWDVYSDLTIADELTESGESISAGLTYLFVCFPALYVFSEALGEKLSSYRSSIVFIANLSLSISLSFAMIYAFWRYPLLFRYPAIFIGILVVITKGLAIFVHTPEMKKTADRMMMAEFKTEAPLQLLLLLHLWVSGRPLFVSPILSSLLVIGKVNAEIYLSDEPGNLMKGKSFLQKFLLTLKYVPLFTSAAFFRLGCGILKHSGPYASEVSETFHALVFFVSVWVDGVFSVLCYLLIFAGVKLGFPGSLADITFEELGRSTHAEFTTVSNWGRLGRDRSK